MFYSPTKEFVRFNSYRTAEIKALKDRITKEKVTPDEILNTQSRLEKLKKQSDLLMQQGHSDLKMVLQNSDLAINELMQEKAMKEKEASLKQHQIEDMEMIKMELQEKGTLIEEQLRKQIKEKQELLKIKQQNNEHILLLDCEYNDLMKQMEAQRQIRQQIDRTETQINKKWEEFHIEKEKCLQEKEDLTRKVYSQKDQVQRMKAQWDICQKQIEKHQILIEKGKITEQLLKSKMNALTVMKLRSYQNEWQLGEQNQIEVNLDSVIKILAEETTRVQKEQGKYQKQIKETLTRVGEQQQMKKTFEQKIVTSRNQLKLLKDKNENLKQKMNSIFKNDCELIKTISSKKVYPNCKPEIIEIVKKSAIKQIETKQNVALPLLDKHQRIESSHSQSRAFAQTNRAV